ncbi:Phosphotransferase enzyme family protein [Yoonia tamlensis]|uniref:Phosphotransferase enzyme family protein n=1 Tax=Yoonia tamlensis TaxID=390270 RepID=A0A1I6GV18_9RHOB|nr:phosphotransferase [Yoonia tamlensis]SFR46052.1 Phosphotransferase enzyme family protein [Yoonia tamlensis]
MNTDINRLLDRGAEQEAAIARWDAVQPHSALLGQITRGALLGAKTYSGVFAATYQGVQVIVRHIARPNAHDLATKMQADLAFVGPQMNAGDCQINQLIAADPAHGVLVASLVPGVPYHATSDPALLEHAGRWHATYVGARRAQAHLSPMFWQKKLKQIPRNGLDGDDLALAQELREDMRFQTHALKGALICRVAGHGDFAPHNFRVHDGVLYGFDTGTAAKVPLARELAHFLLHVALKSDELSGPWGIGDAQVAAFTQAAGLPEAEVGTVLRYFYGWYLYKSILRYARNAGRRARLVALIRLYLDPLG